MDDLIPLILQYASLLPKYRRVCRTWDKATDINIDLGYHIDLYIYYNYKDLYVSLPYRGDRLPHMKKILDNDDWDVILRLISSYPSNIERVGILCNFLYSNKKFDYCDKIYNFLLDTFHMEKSYNPIAPFIIYHMYKNKYKGRITYARYFYDEIYPSAWIGYTHPDMVLDLSLDIKHIRSYSYIGKYCGLPESNILSHLNIDIQDTKDVILYKYITKCNPDYTILLSFPIKIYNE